MTDAPIRVALPRIPRPSSPVPHPRASAELITLPLGPDEADELQLAALPELPLAAAPRGLWLTARPAAGRLSIGFDLALTLALALTAAAVGMLSLQLALLSAVLWPVLLLTAGHYRRSLMGETRTARLALVLGTGLRAAVIALAVSPFLGSVDLIALAELVAVFSVASALPPLVGTSRQRTRLVLAGRPRDVREAVLELAASDRHEVVAACLTRASKKSLGDLPTYVGFDGSADVAGHHGADALVVLPGARLTPTVVRRLHWGLAAVGAELCLGTGLVDVEPQRTRRLSTAGFDVLHVTRPVLNGPLRLVKDVVERTLALVGLLAVLPLLTGLCVAIRLGSPGPAVFRQERIGRDGVPFTMFKLRSMCLDAESGREELVEVNEKDGVLFKIRLDPRVTPLGRLLRRYSLDELPQLWNVVRGDMSLVGPRPALPSEVATYDTDPRRRLVVKPGVTGLWQVSGRSDLTWAESVRLDIKYVDNWSLALDLRILARTVRAVLGHRGAY